MTALLVLGKILFSYLFVTSGLGHFKALEAMTGYAKYKKLPFAKAGVIASGVLLVVAPILFIFSVAQVASLIAIAAFLTVTAFVFHPYWKETEATARMNEMIAFNKEISLIGAIIVILTLL